MENRKPKTPTKAKTEKAGAGEKKSTLRKSVSNAAVGTPGAATKTNTVVSAEPVTLPPEWTSHGAIALVSHGALGGITVIHTEVPPGTQLQPIVTTDTTGTGIISLDGSTIPVPFSIPVSVAHSIPVSSEASSPALTLPSVLSVPVCDGTLASVSEVPVSASSVLEAAASQTILAPVSETEAPSEADILHPNIHTVIVADASGKEETATVRSDGQQSTGDDILVTKEDCVHNAV